MCMYSMRSHMNLRRLLPRISATALILGLLLQLCPFASSIGKAVIGSVVLAALCIACMRFYVYSVVEGSTLMLLSTVCIIALLELHRIPLRSTLLVAGSALYIYSVTRFSSLAREYTATLSMLSLSTIIPLMLSRDLTIASIHILFAASAIALLALSYRAKGGIGLALIFAAAVALLFVMGLAGSVYASMIVASMGLGYSAKLVQESIFHYLSEHRR